MRVKLPFRKRVAFTIGKLAIKIGGRAGLHDFVETIYKKRKTGQIKGQLVFIGRTTTPLKSVFDAVGKREGQKFGATVLDFPRAFFDHNTTPELIEYIRKNLPNEREVTLIDDGGEGKFLPRLKQLFEWAGFTTHTYPLGFNNRVKTSSHLQQTRRKFSTQLARLSLAHSGHPYRIEPKLKKGKIVKSPTHPAETKSRQYLERELADRKN